MRFLALALGVVLVSIRLSGCVIAPRPQATWLDRQAAPPCTREPGALPRPSGPRTIGLEHALQCETPLFLVRTTMSDNAAGAGFRAGFAESDITPPPGYSTVGYGPEARIAVGSRNRLHARALVVQGSNGELLALALADLVGVSSVLHREVAVKVFNRTGGQLGADRIVLSATHTHLGPGHYFSALSTNLFGGVIGGFDPALVDHLSTRIADAIVAALWNLRPARAAWTIRDVWGHTRNRAVASYRLNSTLTEFPIAAPPIALDESHTLVNPRWALLRVDTVTATGGWALAGSYSIFAIHSTGIPAASDVYDADLNGVLSRKLKRAAGGGIHMVANSTEGDVSPDWPPDSRCAGPRPKPQPRPDGPHTPAPLVDWQSIGAEQRSHCLDVARAYVDTLTTALAAVALEMINATANRSLQSDATNDAQATEFPVQRVVRSFDMQGDEARRNGACAEPRAGTALAGGAPDGVARYAGWKLLGIWSLGTESGGAAVDSSETGCHRPKRQLFGPFQAVLVGSTGFARVVDLAVFRVGDMMIGSMPGEMTTRAGQRVLAALDASRPAGVPAGNVAVLGLANEYLNYITTEEEYGAQSYEGGATLYGPRTANVLTAALADLAGQLAAGGSARDISEIPIQPGLVNRIWPDGAPVEVGVRLAPGYPRCSGDTLAIAWTEPTAASMPAPDLSERHDGAFVPINNNVDVEVRRVRSGGRASEWTAVWHISNAAGRAFRIGWQNRTAHKTPPIVCR